MTAGVGGADITEPTGPSSGIKLDRSGVRGFLGGPDKPASIADKGRPGGGIGEGGGGPELAR